MYSATLAAMDESSPRRTPSSARAVALVALAMLLLAAPAALAQSAGDRQYSDPLAGGDGQGAPAPRPQGGDAPADSGAPAGGETPTPVPEPVAPTATDGAETAPGSPSAALPRTGADAALLAVLGLALLTVGALLRLRAGRTTA